MTDVPASPGELLRVRHEVTRGGVVLHASGEVDLVTAPLLVAALTEAEELLAAPGSLVVDLTEVTFLASVGLATLVDLVRRAREAGIDLRVVTGNRAVARTFLATGLNDVLPLYDTLPEAIAAAP